MTLAPPIDPAAAAAADAAEIELAGARLTLDHSGAIWWADEQMLVVSDLHLEKGSAFAARGAPLPPYDTRATLARLETLVERLRPQCVLALGDSFHDAGLDERMGSADRATLALLVASVSAWVWIAGNHDPTPPRRLGGAAAEELSLGGLTFRHEPTGAPGEVAGHLHPCGRVARRGRMLRRRCFASDGARLVAPAFGAFAGGLNLCDPAFAPAFPEAPPTAHMLGRDRVWPVDFGQLLPD